MKKIILLSVLSLQFAYSQYEVQNKKTDSLVAESMRKLKIPAMAVAIVKDGKVIKKAVYGIANLEWQSKTTAHTNFQIASCTKLLTSTLLLKALYAKRIDLEQPVSVYLDSVPASWDGVKVKHLISHSSGIPDAYDSDAYVPVPDIAAQIKKKPLLFAPGTKELYGQSDFMLLVYILEKIYNKPFVELLRDEVTRPLHMNDGAFDMEWKVEGRFMRTNLVPEKATTYYDDKGKLVAYKFLYPQYTYSAGGYFASIDDMAAWAVGLDKSDLFPLGFADRLIYRSDKIGTGDAGFSKVGWALEREGNTVYGGHSGGPGLADILRFREQKVTVIVLSNDGELLPRFARAIAGWYVAGLPEKIAIEKFDR